MTGSNSMQKTTAQKPPAVREVVQKIKGMIEEGEIQPGDRLPAERDLAERMDVSRPTIREAIQSLSLLGIVENRPCSGTYLLDTSGPIPPETLDLLFMVNKTAIMDIFEARKNLEPQVASLAAKRRTDDDLEAMRKALLQMHENIDDPFEYIKHETTFHLAVVYSAHNEILTSLIERLYGFMSSTRTQVNASSLDPKIREDDFQRHNQLYEFIKDQNDQSASATLLYDLVVFEKKVTGKFLGNGSKDK